jgi:succinate dehydrogenase assembly factor 2
LYVLIKNTIYEIFTRVNYTACSCNIRDFLNENSIFRLDDLDLKMIRFTTLRFVRYNKNIISNQLPIKPITFILSRNNTSTTDSNPPPTAKKVVHDSEVDPSLPYRNLPPIPRPNESIEQKRSRLLYQSRKRGILETDLILSTFANKYLKTFNEQELKEYDELLDTPDWDIYYFTIDKKPIPDTWKNSVIFNKLKQHVKNEGRAILRVPDL